MPMSPRMMSLTLIRRIVFSKKGDELRYKLQELGFSNQEAEDLEDDLDEGNVLFMVQDDRNPDEVLT